MITNTHTSNGAAPVLRGALALALAASLLAAPAAAQERAHRRGVERAQPQHSRQAQVQRPNRNFQHGIRHAPQERHSGRWQHGRHDGRVGWWWISGGLRHYYAAPVYPYPVYSPLVAARPVLQVAQEYWYYCANPSGYYPGIPACEVAWQRVAASAPPGFAR